MLDSSPGRSTVEAALRGLLARGLVMTERALFVGDREYEDDWWVVTGDGRRAIGLPRRRPPARWMNPSSGPFRRAPVNAFFYGIWRWVGSRVMWLLYPDTHWRR
jgi:hypothetical protein